MFADGQRATSTPTLAVEVAPRMLRRPEVLGRPRVGARLKATLGTWEGTNLRFATAWLRCKPSYERVSTGRSYRVRAADRGYRCSQRSLRRMSSSPWPA